MLEERLKSARKAMGISQKDIAKKLFISQQAYAKYETGAATPNPETLKRIAEIFNVSTDYLLGNNQVSKKQTKNPAEITVPAKLPIVFSIADEQKAHDITLSFVNYMSTISGEKLTPEEFYQDYENNYPLFLALIKKYK